MSESTASDIKSKISFSVESLLKDRKEERTVVDEERTSVVEEEEVEESEEEEHIEVDDVDSRESSSPGTHLVVPQPLHPTVPRGLFAAPQWPFSWIGPGGPVYRSTSPQSKAFFKHNFTLKMTRRPLFLFLHGR